MSPHPFGFAWAVIPICPWGLFIRSSCTLASYFILLRDVFMVSVEVEDDMIVKHGFAIGPEHGSRRGDCVDDDGFAIDPEHGTRRGDCVDDGGL
jgi:hypothetical protein